MIVAATAYTGSTGFADLSNAFFTLLFFMVVQLPFIQYVQADLEGEERLLRRSYRTFFEFSFSVFLFGVFYGLAAITGLLLLLIPGLIVLVFFYLTPYVTVFKQQTTRHTYRRAYQLGKKHFFKILGLILLVFSVETLLSMLGQLGMAQFSSNLSSLFIVQVLVNLVVIPYFVVLTTMIVYGWENGGKEYDSI
jgi:hypothetical protein